MLKFYNNRELARNFQINIAKWKRWSREFLSPDPLGGMQSGYARQYHPDQVFTVYFGGYLVAHLKFTIPEAKKVLTDLQKWLYANGFCFNGGKTDCKTKLNEQSGKQYRLFIIRPQSGDHLNGNIQYHIQEIISTHRVQCEGRSIIQEQRVDSFYNDTKISNSPAEGTDTSLESAVMINITGFLRGFVKKLGQDIENYPILSPALRGSEI